LKKYNHDIIITGAGRGIGYETTRHFYNQKGNFIIAVSRDICALQKLSESGSGKKNDSYLYPIMLDLSKKDFEIELFKNVLNRFNKIDILVNNAGVLVNKPIEGLDTADFEKIFSVNVKTPFVLIKALLPHFNNPSHIVNIGSMGGFQGSAKFKGLSLYSASKGALAILTECMAEEFKDRGIHVNCIAPGSVQTEMIAEAFPGFKTPVTAEEMGGFIADFACNGYKVMNGKIIPVSISVP